MRFKNKKQLVEIILMSLLMLGILSFNGNSRNVKADTNDTYKNIEIFIILFF